MKKLILFLVATLVVIPISAVLLAQSIVFPGTAGGPSIGGIGGSVGSSDTLSAGQSNSVVNIINTVAPTNSGITAGEAATQIDNTNTSVIIPEINTSSNLTYLNAVTKINTSSNLIYLNSITAINSSSNLTYLNSITAINSSSNLVFSTSTNAAIQALPSRTNFYNVTNATAGNGVVIVGPDANGNYYLKGTNYPGGGSGSQTPITSDIDYALFAMTNWSRIFTTNITGQFVITSNQTLLSSNAITTTYLRFSTNQYIHIGSNLVDTITLKSTDGSITASNFTATGTAASSNFFGGITYVASNAAPFSTVSPSGLNSVTMNQRWTNDFNRQADLVLSVSVTDAATGVPILAFTNTITGECYTNSPNFGITGTPVYNIIYIGISPNDYGSFSNYSTGTGTAITINKAYWKLH